MPARPATFRHWPRRIALACGLVACMSAGAGEAGRVSVWVTLERPPLADRLQGAAAAPDERQRLAREQDEVMARLRALGAVEQGRVQVVRNALAVSLPADAVEAARRLDGVRSVTPARDREMHADEPAPDR